MSLTAYYILCLLLGTAIGIGGGCLLLQFWLIQQLNQPTNTHNQEQHRQIMKTLQELADLVTATNGVADSLIVLTGDIKRRLDDALAGGLTPEQQAKVDAIFTAIEEEKTELAAALVANTPTPPPAV